MLAASPVAASKAAEPVGASGIEPLARPADRSAERQAARVGLITEAPPVICEGASLPLAGALVILPALAATGLLQAAASLTATGSSEVVVGEPVGGDDVGVVTGGLLRVYIRSRISAFLASNS